MNKKLLCIILITVIVLPIFSFVGCGKKASDYTEEEHIERVTQRVEKRFMTDSTDYTGFSVYPLYNKNDELNYFLVEFEPYGFIFVLLRDEPMNGLSCLGFSTSMYKISNLYGNETWTPYTIDETNSQPFPDTDKCWEVDEAGNKIEYNKSPYYITQNIQERKYLLASNSSAEYICAIKRDGQYINLISSTEINDLSADPLEKQATIYIVFIVKKEFDL